MENASILFGIAAASGLAIRLTLSGLGRRYRSLLLFCLLTIIRTSSVFVWKQDTDNYAYFWMATEIVSWILFLLLVLDVYSSLFEQFRAFAAVGRRVFQWGLSLSVVGSLIFTLVTAPADGPFPIYAALLVTQRAVLSSLILFTLILMAALVYLRLPLRRNTVVFATVFFLYFMAKASLTLLFQTLGPDIRPTVNIVLSLVANACFVAWMMGLSPAGEQTSVRVGHQWNAAEGDKLVRQLSAINESLSRGRK
jgi:hypothetical protein